MIPVMPELPDTQNRGPVRLNVSVDADLHKALRTISLETGEALTQLVPRLLRNAVAEEKKRLKIT